MHYALILLFILFSCKQTDDLWYNDIEVTMSEQEKLVVPGMKIRVDANESASSRTKNRIRERGEFGFVLKNRKTCYALGNRPSLMLMGLEPGKLAGDQWLGWLPEDEIEFEQWVEERKT